MKELIIKQYIDKLTKKDIYEFGIKNNITLNNNNLNIIYNCIKEKWKIIIFGNIEPIFNDLKKEIDNQTLENIKKLYFEFKEKYKNYL